MLKAVNNSYRFGQLLWASSVLLRHRFNVNTRGPYLRRSLEKMGPIFVKFGQALSTRPDILPLDILLELKKLQTDVPPFSGVIAKHSVEKALQQPLAACFQDFDLTPLASASIAQVHAATLLNGEKVAVKILRPNIHRRVKHDIHLLQFLATWLEKLMPSAKQFKAVRLVQEFKKILNEELDLSREAANASQLRRQFTGSTLLYVPKIHWPLAKKNVLVMEKVEGVSLSDLPRIFDLPVDRKQLAEMLLEIFFTQAFHHRFFHADMHPGNLLLSTSELYPPRYIAVDFGMMGTLSQADQYYLAENLMAFLKRDYRRVAELHLISGWVAENTRLEDFEAAIRTVSEPILEQSLTQISLGTLLLSLFQAAKQHHINIQPQLLLLQKTLLNVEGLARELYPEIDLLNTLKPLLETWLKKNFRLSTWIQKVISDIL
jgi:ubiquinone biosynthesis protein